MQACKRTSANKEEDLGNGETNRITTIYDLVSVKIRYVHSMYGISLSI
jgi:hypothetical protein